MEEINELKNVLLQSVAKKIEESSASIAYSKSGKSYKSGSVDSDTNLMHISSEQAALALSVLNKDYGVYKIVTLTNQDEKIAVSPIILKVIVDYGIRTDLEEMEYKIADKNGEVFFETKNVARELPFYKPEKIEISRTKGAAVEKNFQETKITDPLELRNLAIKGLERNFPLYDSASGYGTAVATKKKIYFGGQYSSPEKRMNLHSEMTTIISAIMAGEREIESIGVVSSKYLDSPCDMCGICRQFIAEICAKFKINPTLYAFSKEAPVYKSYSIQDYLPSAWSSKKWI